MIETLHRTAKGARRTVSTWLFERRYNVHTAGRVDLEDLGLAHDERVYYIASNWRNIRRVLRRQPISRSDVFLDLGSGMGRMVCEATRFPFRRVIGVELSPDLHRIAQRNVQSYRPRQRCGEVQLVNCDAMHYQIPDDVTVLYMFNPFRGGIFAAVLEELLRSFDRAPRPLRVIYANPEEESQLLATGRFQLVNDVVSGWRQGDDSVARSIRTYLVDPVLIPTASRDPQQNRGVR